VLPGTDRGCWLLERHTVLLLSAAWQGLAQPLIICSSTRQQIQRCSASCLCLPSTGVQQARRRLGWSAIPARHSRSGLVMEVLTAEPGPVLGAAAVVAGIAGRGPVPLLGRAPAVVLPEQSPTYATATCSQDASQLRAAQALSQDQGAWCHYPAAVSLCQVTHCMIRWLTVRRCCRALSCLHSIINMHNMPHPSSPVGICHTIHATDWRIQSGADAPCSRQHRGQRSTQSHMCSYTKLN
jgi:hypothetical protein